MPSVGAVESGIGEREPGGPLGTGVALVRILDDGARSRALVRLEMTSNSEDLEVTVKAAGEPRGRAAGELMSRATLVKGRPHTILVESELEPNRENHLFYRVEGRGPDGVRADTIVYLRVNLDPALEPDEVEGYLVYQGAEGTEVPQ